ncbi:hypothetical protein ACET3Z_014717 [Daucus carota]
MEKYGFKRPPLSPLSPSSIQRGQRRRIPANESSDGCGSRVCKENQHPNLTAQKSTPGDSVLTVENEYNYVREGCLSHESRNGKNSCHSKPRADNSLKASLSGTADDYCTPSQRRLRDVDLSGYTADEGNTATPTPRPVQLSVETMTLNELSEKITADYIKKQVFCVVKVMSVEENGWWCNTCGGCGTEVEKQDGKLFCTICDHCIPVAEKRYRVVILGEDSTEAFNFVLMDRGVKRMVGISATKMISNKLKNQSTEFPEEIRAITGKELRIKLLISEDNVKVNSRLFFAVDTVDADAPVSAICSVSGTSSTTSSITNSSAVKHLEETETPSTSKSSTKRVKVEL